MTQPSEVEMSSKARLIEGVGRVLDRLYRGMFMGAGLVWIGKILSDDEPDTWLRFVKTVMAGFLIIHAVYPERGAR